MEKLDFKNTFGIGPVTALKICGKFVLSGIGNCLHVYHSQSREYVACQPILHCRNIHGIRQKPDESILCVYGEKCFQLVTLSLENLSLDCCNEQVVLEDWILDITWLKEEGESGNGDQLGIVVAHNVVLLWDVTTRALLQRVSCQEKCILYCGHLIGSTWSSLVLAAGTVFNHVILWSPWGGTSSSEHRHVAVLHSLTGHQGVIFSLDYHPVRKLLASVSDDRTIRLWSLTLPVIGQSGAHIISNHLLTLYGHSARVWDIHLLDDVFVSIGEDAKCLVWDYSGNILHKFRGHKGKSIWSLACEKEGNYVVTGGGDSSIRMWMLRDDTTETGCSNHGNTQSLLSHVSLTVPSHHQGSEDDFARSVALSGEDNILAMTNEGRLLKYQVSSARWVTVYHDSAFSSYTVMALSPGGSLVAIGNITGIIKIFSVDDGIEVCVEQLYKGKVFGLVWVDAGHLLTTGPDGQMFLLLVPSLARTASLTLPACKQRWASAGGVSHDLGVLVCGDRGGTVHCYNISRREGQQEAPSLPVTSFGKIHGKAGVTDVCFHGNKIYTSGRDGKYRLWEIVEHDLHLRSSHKVMKGMEWIDKLQVTDDDMLVYGFHSSQFTVWSERENLRLAEVECGGGHRAWDCHLVDNNMLRFVYLKSKQIILCDTPCRSRQVILKGCLHGREMCDVKHLFSLKDRHGRKVPILATASEDTTVQITSLTSENDLPTLKVMHTLQGHLSTVKTLSVIPSCVTARDGINGSGDKTMTESKLLFSGGGRAQIQVWRVTMDRSVIKNDKCFQKTTLSQDGKSLNTTKDTLTTSISNSESLLNPEASTLSESAKTNICDSQNSKSQVPSVSYEHLANVFVCGDSRKGGNPDPETRVMCLTSFCLRDVSDVFPPHLSVVAAACSDAFVRVFAFDEKERELILLQQSSYHDNCVLKVNHIIHKAQNQYKILLLSGATDGQIAFWDITIICDMYVKEMTTSDIESSKLEGTDAVHKKIHTSRLSSRRTKILAMRETMTEELSPLVSVSAHQSGINSLHCFHSADGLYLVASGGDDNALTVTSVSVDTDDIHVQQCAKNTTAHAAQITGVWMVSADHIVSASIDQRICVWQLHDQKLTMRGSRYIYFSDVANIDVWKDRRSTYVCVCGQGLSVLELCEEEHLS